MNAMFSTPIVYKGIVYQPLRLKVRSDLVSLKFTNILSLHFGPFLKRFHGLCVLYAHGLYL